MQTPTSGLFLYIKAGVMWGLLLVAVIYAFMFTTPPSEDELVSLSGVPTNVVTRDFMRRGQSSQEVAFTLESRNFTYHSPDKDFARVKATLDLHGSITVDVHPRKNYSLLSGLTRFWGFRNSRD